MRRSIQPLFGRRSRYGPAPRFERWDAFRAVWRLERRIGRARLAASLGLGEGSMRTIINRLSKEGLIDSAPMGHRLTRRGFAMLKRLKLAVASIRAVHPGELTFRLPAVAMHVRGAGEVFRTAALRDEAIRSGARGCTILQLEGGRLVLPPYHGPTHRAYAEELSRLQREFPLAKGDVLIIAYGGGPAANERALWAVFSKLTSSQKTT